MTSVICLCGWERFQHYKDRDPTWVKLYRDLLSSESWVLGTDVSRLVQVASVLLAARYSNQIPLQWNLIKKVSSLDCSEKQFMEAVRYLSSTYFLEIQQVTEQTNGVAQDASALLAACSSEKRREEKREGASAPVVGLDLKAWEEWNTYRTATKKPIRTASRQRAQEELARYGSQQAVVVAHSIANSYQGLFAPKNLPKAKEVMHNPDGSPALFAGKPVEW